MHGDTEIGLEENCKSSSMQDELKTDYKKLLFILELHMSSTRFRWKTQAMKAYKQGTTLWYMRQSCCLWAQQPIWAATHVSDTPLSTQFPGHENSGGWPKSSGPLSPTRESRRKILASDSGLAQPWQLSPTEEGASRWKNSVSLPFSL